MQYEKVLSGPAKVVIDAFVQWRLHNKLQRNWSYNHAHIRYECFPHFKNINKAEFTNGKYKKITIPYDHNLSVKYGVADFIVDLVQSGQTLKENQLFENIIISSESDWCWYLANSAFVLWEI